MRTEMLAGGNSARTHSPTRPRGRAAFLQPARQGRRKTKDLANENVRRIRPTLSVGFFYVANPTHLRVTHTNADSRHTGNNADSQSCRAGRVRGLSNVHAACSGCDAVPVQVVVPYY